MRGKAIALSAPRRFLVDLLHFAAQIPSIPVQRQLCLREVAAARGALARRPCWPAIFIKAYALVADEFPVLRRAYLGLPWPHLREYPLSIASLAVEREYRGEPCVFFGRIPNPGRLPLGELHAQVREFAEAPIDQVRPFRKMLSFARWPRFMRRTLLQLGLNIPNTRPGQFGTFGLSVYSSLGAESLHPLSPLTSTLNYGVIAPSGDVSVRMIYDHRVFDGSTAARALGRLEEILHGAILAELRDLAARTLAA
jgi:hypothetical protein